MSDNNALGDRMKAHEAICRTTLPRRTWTILRLDGRSFGTYTRGLEKPFDETFVADMNSIAEELCNEISGAEFAYTQSDEISILVTDFATPQTQAWFGGVVAKMLSVSASLATAVLNERRPGKRGLFDARAFTLSDPVEVAQYFVWRQRDAVRNSISMAAQAYFSHKELQGVNSSQMQEMLFKQADVNWNNYPAGCKRGRVTTKETGEKETEYFDKRINEMVCTTAVRSWWKSSTAQHFTLAENGWLAQAIPTIPGFTASPSDKVAV